MVCAAALVLTLLVAEGMATGYPPTAVATTVSGGLCVAALLVPAGWFFRTAALAASCSVALSAVSTQLSQRPEVTPGMAELAALMLMTTRAVRGGRPLSGTALVVGCGLATALVPLRLPESEYANVGNLMEPVLAFGLILAAVLGLYLRRTDTFRTRERKADLQEQRLEHARELHDFVAHHVTAMIAQTKAVRYATAQGRAPDPDDLDVLLAGIEQAGAQAMESMRGMVSVLRSDQPGGPVAPGGSDLGSLRELTEAATRTGTPATLTVDPALPGMRLTPEVTTAVHRVVREALTNVRKHGSGVEAVTVDVRLSPQDGGRAQAKDRPQDGGRLCVSVTDDGRSAAARPAGSRGGGGGYGLVGLTERVRALGGTLISGPREPRPDGESPAGRGWRVEAQLPVRAHADGLRR